eukprot:4713567-Pyramimonas_sp.AAC.1
MLPRPRRRPNRHHGRARLAASERTFAGGQQEHCRSPNRGHYQTTRPPLKKCPLKNPRRKLSPRGQYSSTGKQVNGTSHGTSTVSLTVPILVSGEACQPPPLVEGDSHVCSEARGWHPNARAPAGL